MAARNQQKHLSLSFLQMLNSSLEELINLIKVIIILRQGMFRQQNLKKTVIFFNPHKRFSCCQLNAVSGKSVEIQASLVATQRTLLN